MAKLNHIKGMPMSEYEAKKAHAERDLKWNAKLAHKYANQFFLEYLAYPNDILTEKHSDDLIKARKALDDLEDIMKRLGY